MRLYTQAEKDSMADADTLLRYLESRYCASRLMGGPPARPLHYGRLRNLLWNGVPLGKPRELARAAFQCVPALRVPDFESEEDK